MAIPDKCGSTKVVYHQPNVQTGFNPKNCLYLLNKNWKLYCHLSSINIIMFMRRLYQQCSELDCVLSNY